MEVAVVKLNVFTGVVFARTILSIASMLRITSEPTLARSLFGAASVLPVSLKGVT